MSDTFLIKVHSEKFYSYYKWFYFSLQISTCIKVLGWISLKSCKSHSVKAPAFSSISQKSDWKGIMVNLSNFSFLNLRFLEYLRLARSASIILKRELRYARRIMFNQASLSNRFAFSPSRSLVLLLVSKSLCVAIRCNARFLDRRIRFLAGRRYPITLKRLG